MIEICAECGAMLDPNTNECILCGLPHVETVGTELKFYEDKVYHFSFPTVDSLGNHYRLEFKGKPKILFNDDNSITGVEFEVI